MPRSAPGLIASTFELYRRYPWLFLALAALVVIPYNLIFLAATGFGRLEDSSLAEAVGLSLLLLEIGLLTPLVSALHVHAVVAVRAGEQPRIGAVTRLGLAALPVVVAASLMAWLGIFAGFIALIVPGVYLFLRWFVVAQAAAIEREGWSDALERSATLVSGNYLHVFVLALIVFGIGFVFEFLGSHAFGDSTGPVSFLASIVVQVLVWSFTALATALLYFDLRARRQRAFAQGLPEASSGAVPVLAPEPPAGEDPVLASKPFDAVDAAWGAGSYSDEERPPGWYVDPTASNRLRYWGADPPGWSKSIRMSRKMRRAIRSEEVERGTGRRQ
ncbi:MAG TPA: hypothetical protein VFJ57_09860 [Solirubrobacterales bacterium]|nr:hypothetical protein [Solirubrobacterales bacterium]